MKNDPPTEFDPKALETDVIQAIRTVYDPEIPINVYELGLIYHIVIEPPGIVSVQMTLTTPNCPEAQTLPSAVAAAIKAVERVVDVHIELVWDPPWTKERIPEEMRLLLGMD